MQGKNEVYQRILDSMREGFVLHDAEGGIVHFNEAALTILGLTADQLLGRTSIDVNWKIIKEDGSDFPGHEHPAYLTAISGIAYENILMGVMTPERQLRWLRVNSVPLHVKFENADIRALATFSDVSLEVEKLRQLKAQDAAFREAQQVAQIGSWSFDLASSQITWTDQLFKMFPREISQGPPDFETLLSYVHCDDREEWKHAVGLCMSKGVPYAVRHRVVFPDRTVWVEGRGRASFDSDGKVTSLGGTCQEITERMELEQENEFITSALKVGMWKLNPITRELDWDQGMYSVFGIERSDFSGTYEAWESALTPESKVKAVRELELALKGEKEFDTSFEILTKSGETRSIGARGIVIRNDNGEPTAVYGINWDRTKETRLEEALNRERAKLLQSSKLASLGEMSAGIAHEINNPLAIISGAVSLLERSAQDKDKLHKKVETIARSVERIAKIVNGLQKFSRSTEQKNYTSHSIARIIEDVLVLTSSKSARMNVPIHCELVSKGSILCDDVEIEQVMVNLLNNAIDAVSALPERWVKVSVRDEDASLVVRITDSGNGIPEGIRAKIFEPFFTTKKVGQGTGLGLSITKGIIEEHGAAIQVLNDGSHTCFQLTFARLEVRNAA